MSKLHRTESLESLLANDSPPQYHQRRSARRVWVILTYINSVILLITLAVTASSLHLLTTRMTPDSSVETSTKQASDSLRSQAAPSHDHTSTKTPSDWLTCGNTTVEAQQNGCIFDLMLSTWLHPECYWEEHSASALSMANLTFYLDEALSVPFEDAGSGDWPQHYIWTEPRYHALHCSYMWERQIKSFVEGDKIDSQCWNVPHTKHCAMTVLEPNAPYGYKAARLRRGFSDCGRP